MKNVFSDLEARQMAILQTIRNCIRAGLISIDEVGKFERELQYQCTDNEIIECLLKSQSILDKKTKKC